MSIIYCAIVKNFKNILCEYTESSGNFQQISMQILLNLRSNELDNSMCLEYDELHRIYISIQEKKLLKENIEKTIEYKLIVLCLVTKDNYNDKLIYDFLENLINSLHDKYDEIYLANAQSFSLTDFIETLSKEMHKVNSKIKKSTKEYNPSNNESGLFKNTGKIL